LPTEPHRRLGLLDSGHLIGAVMLQRADSAGTDGRVDVFNRAAAEWTCCWRPVWIPGSDGNGRWWFSWFVWLPGQSGPPVKYAAQTVRAAKDQLNHLRHHGTRGSEAVLL